MKMLRICLYAVLVGVLGYLCYLLAGFFMTVAFLALVAAFLILAWKLPTGDAIRLFAFAVGITVIMLGGGSIVARQWGVGPAMIWVVCWIVVLMLLQRPLQRWVRVFHLARLFEEIVQERLKRKH
jgi:hypothetical protein